MGLKFMIFVGLIMLIIFVVFSSIDSPTSFSVNIDKALKEVNLENESVKNIDKKDNLEIDTKGKIFK